MSDLFKLNSSDFIKGLVVAIAAATLTWLAGIINVPGFTVASVDWGELLRIAFAAGAAYVGKNFFTDQSGKLLGRI